MKQNSVYIMVIMAFILILLSINTVIARTQGYGEYKDAPPFFDGSTDPNLKLYSSTVTENPIGWEHYEKHGFVSKKYMDKMKSNTFTENTEHWDCKSYDVDITIWRFNFANDAIIFPYTGLTTGPNDRFRGWDKTTTIGDKTYWDRYDIVIFAKGKAIVRVFVHGRLAKEQKKEYTTKIAESIVKKL
ncbi:MAG: hypothetical protein AB9903_13270 [Vulcanimicrobiota bacterium]